MCYGVVIGVGVAVGSWSGPVRSGGGPNPACAAGTPLMPLTKDIARAKASKPKPAIFLIRVDTYIVSWSFLGAWRPGVKLSLQACNGHAGR